MVRTFSTGSTNFFKAVEGVRGRWAQRNAESLNKDGQEGNTIPSSSSSSVTEPPVEVNKSDFGKSSPPMPTTTAGALRPFALGLRRPSNSNVGAVLSSPESGMGSESGSSTSGSPASPPPPPVSAALASWGAGIGSFISTRLAKQPTVQGPEKEDSGSNSGSVSGRNSVSSGTDEGGNEERVRDEVKGRASEPAPEPMTPTSVSPPKINATTPRRMAPRAVEGTPPLTPSRVAKTRAASTTPPTGPNGVGGRVRAAILERERAKVEWSPKDVTSGARLPPRDVAGSMRLPPRDVGDKPFGTTSMPDFPPYRANSKAAKEVGEDLYPPWKDMDVHFKDPFTTHVPRAKVGDDAVESQPVQHGTNLDLPHGSTDGNAYSNSINSMDEEDAYAGMAL